MLEWMTALSKKEILSKCFKLEKSTPNNIKLPDLPDHIEAANYTISAQTGS
jgi:hypothetical protein